MFPISCLKMVSDDSDESLIGIEGIPCRCLAGGRKATKVTQGKQESLVAFPFEREKNNSTGRFILLQVLMMRKIASVIREVAM